MVGEFEACVSSATRTASFCCKFAVKWASEPAWILSSRGHPVWSLTFMVQGKKQVQHIPKDWVEEVRRRVKAGREFQDAVREVLAANAQLLVLERKKLKKK